MGEIWMVTCGCCASDTIPFWPLTFLRTWWWEMRRASCAPCWRSTTPWRMASYATGMTCVTSGTTRLAQRSSTSNPKTARSFSQSRPWTPPRTGRRSLRCVLQLSASVNSLLFVVASVNYICYSATIVFPFFFFYVAKLFFKSMIIRYILFLTILL